MNSSSITSGHRIGEALMHLLEEHGIITKELLSATIDRLDGFGQRLAGADLVVRAWMDPQFKQRLLHNAATAAEEIGISVSNPNAPTVLIVVENTPVVHHLIVCTLCSCYPSSVLGLSPSWYKSKNYRARAVLEPRALLAEFGTILPSETRLMVHDSTADCRYMVLPLRPEGTEGWSEDQLRQLVTRDSMIGVSQLNC
jgi:nitrile hydratase